LNFQAVADCRGRILDMSITYGGASSDCLAFEASDMWHRLENGLLKPGYVLFGDNAYLNSVYMATPFPNVSQGPKDNYNFYHSQVCILFLPFFISFPCSPYVFLFIALCFYSFSCESVLNARLVFLLVGGPSFDP